MSNVRSEPLKDGKTSSRGADLSASLSKSADTLPWRAAGLVSLVVGGSFWLIGARYTILGAPRVIDMILSLFGISLHIVLPVGWPLLWLTILVGAVVSMTEFGCRPRRSFFSRSLVLGIALFLIWAIVNAGDLSSTFLAVTLVEDDSGALTRWVATTEWASIAWTCFLSYCPELLIIGGWRWLIKGGF
jgi:hypothetical protein